MDLQTLFPLIFIASLTLAMSFELLVNELFPDLPALPFVNLTTTANRIINSFRGGRVRGAIDKKQRPVKNAEEHLRMCERKLTQAETGRDYPWTMSYNNKPHLAVVEKVDHQQNRVTFLILEVEHSCCACTHPVYTFTTARPICLCAGCGETSAWQTRRVSMTPNTMKNRGAKVVHPFDAPPGFALAEQLVKYVNKQF